MTTQELNGIIKDRDELIRTFERLADLYRDNPDLPTPNHVLVGGYQAMSCLWDREKVIDAANTIARALADTGHEVNQKVAHNDLQLSIGVGVAEVSHRMDAKKLIPDPQPPTVPDFTERVNAAANGHGELTDVIVEKLEARYPENGEAEDEALGKLAADIQT